MTAISTSIDSPYETATKSPLSSKTILLHLEIRRWSGEVADKKALQAVAKAYKSDTQRDKYRKSLFVTDALGEINLHAGRIRTNFYASTVPWLDSGAGRLIPARAFRDFAIAHSHHKMDFESAVEDFLADYEHHKSEAKRLKGDLYNEHEYPPIADLRERFGVFLHPLPFPDVEDIRIEAPQSVIEDLQTSMRDSVARVGGIVSADIAQRLQTRLQMLVKTLRVGQRFSASLLDKLEEVVVMGEQLEEVLDNTLVQKLAQVRLRILKLTPDDLRNSQHWQNETIENCEALMR